MSAVAYVGLSRDQIAWLVRVVEQKRVETVSLLVISGGDQKALEESATELTFLARLLDRLETAAVPKDDP